MKSRRGETFRHPFESRQHCCLPILELEEDEQACLFESGQKVPVGAIGGQVNLPYIMDGGTLNKPGSKMHAFLCDDVNLSKFAQVCFYFFPGLKWRRKRFPRIKHLIPHKLINF